MGVSKWNHARLFLQFQLQREIPANVRPAIHDDVNRVIFCHVDGGHVA